MNDDWFFAHPEDAVGLLWLVWVLLGATLLWRHRKEVSLRWKGLGELGMLVERSGTLYWVKLFFLALAWVLLVFALMDPRTRAYPLAVSEEIMRRGGERGAGTDILFCIDYSSSMKTVDRDTTRLDRAKELVALLIEGVKGGEVALYGFTAEAFPLVPLTWDRLFVLMTLQGEEKREEEPGTDLAVLLRSMRDLHRELTEEGLKKPRLLILISDGEDHLWEEDPVGRGELLRTLAQELGREGWRFLTVGVGSKEGGRVPDLLYEGQPVVSRLSEEPLKIIAAASGGRYFFLKRSWDLFRDIAQFVDALERNEEFSFHEPRGDELPLSVPSDDPLFQPLLFSAYLALLCFFFFPNF